MNGVRSTFKRKGHLLSALAAAVLLAASPGTAAAQNTTGVTITGPDKNTVNEGGTASYTVEVKGYVDTAPDADNARNPTTVSVTLATPSPDNSPAETAGDTGDLNSNGHVLVANFEPPNNSSTTQRLYYTETKTISVATLGDNDAEDEHFTLEFSLAGADQLKKIAATTGAGSDDNIGLAAKSGEPATSEYNPGILIIDDAETQTYTLTLKTKSPKEGAAFMVDLAASPDHDDGTSKTIQVNLDKTSGWTLVVEGESEGNNRTTVGNNTETKVRTLTITQTSGDKNRVTDTVIVSAHTGLVGKSKEIASLSVDVADLHALQAVTVKVSDKDGEILDPQPTSVKEGETTYIVVRPVDKDGKVTTANEKLKVVLKSSGSADSRDYEVGAAEILAGRNTSSAVKLTIVGGDDDVGMETLMFDATVSGEDANGKETKDVAGVLSIDIEDATEKKVAPKSDEDLKKAVDAAIAAGGGDEGLNPGESFTLMADDLFEAPMDGYNMSIGTSVQGDGSISVTTSGSSVEVSAVKAGESTLTVTATAAAASSATGSQTVSNVAQVDIPLTVTDKVLTLTLAAPDAMDGAVIEGMSYDITVTANRAVLEDTEVMFMRSDMSEADVRDYSIDNVTIMAGEMMAAATLMVNEDMMDDSPESLHLYGMAGETMTNTIELSVWDEAVPALPLIAQLLLGLFLTAGGARLYRRRQG